jgi:protein ImuA
MPHAAAVEAVLPPPSAASPAVHRLLPEREEARALIARLRAHLDRTADHFQGRTQRGEQRPLRRNDPQRFHWGLGVEVVDRNLPEGGLAVNGLHDISPAAYGDFPAACGFALALAVRRLKEERERRPILWCRLETEQREYGRSFGHGVVQMGVPRQRFLSITLRKPVALLWTLEEALKSGCLSVVLGDVATQYADLTATRRLALAAQAGRASGIIVLTRYYEDSTASVSRWCIATSASQSLHFNPQAPGVPAWDVTLTRVRSGRPGQWRLNWQSDHASSCFTVVPGLSGGALHPGTAEAPGSHTSGQPALRAG